MFYGTDGYHLKYNKKQEISLFLGEGHSLLTANTIQIDKPDL